MSDCFATMHSRDHCDLYTNKGTKRDETKGNT